MRRPAWYLRLAIARLREDPLTFPGAVGRVVVGALPGPVLRLLGRGSRVPADAEKPGTLPRDDAPPAVRGRVSVVLPVYDQADLLGEAIASVQAQVGVDWELIVLDDGSTDAIEPVLTEAVADPRVRILRQHNRGLPAALRAGFAFATGEFVTWTSADNVLEPGMLATMVAVLRGRPDAAMAYADYRVVDAGGAPLEGGTFFPQFRAAGSSVVRLPRETSMLNSRVPNFIGPCFLLRGWVRRCLPDWRGAQGIEDYDYWMRLNAAFRIVHAANDEPLYRYRWHDNSLNARARELDLLGRNRDLLAREGERAAWRARPWTLCVGRETVPASYRTVTWEGRHVDVAKCAAVLGGDEVTDAALAPAAGHFTIVRWDAAPPRSSRLDHPRVLHVAGDPGTAAELACVTERVVSFDEWSPEALAFCLVCGDAATAEPDAEPDALPRAWLPVASRPSVSVIGSVGRDEVEQVLADAGYRIDDPEAEVAVVLDGTDAPGARIVIAVALGSTPVPQNCTALVTDRVDAAGVPADRVIFTNGGTWLPLADLVAWLASGGDAIAARPWW